MKKLLLPLLVCFALLCGLLSGCMGSGEDAELGTELTSPPESAVTETAAASPTPDVTPSAGGESSGAAESPAPAATDTPAGEEQSPDAALQCAVSIDCSTVLSNLDSLKSEKRGIIPSDGVILAATCVEFSEGDTVYDVLRRVCSEYNIQLEASFTAAYNTAYIEGIANLYQLDCGTRSGWMYRVNGVYPSYGCSSYTLSDGDVVEWRYTCDLGEDIGGGGRA